MFRSGATKARLDRNDHDDERAHTHTLAVLDREQRRFVFRFALDTVHEIVGWVWLCYAVLCLPVQLICR